MLHLFFIVFRLVVTACVCSGNAYYKTVKKLFNLVLKMSYISFLICEKYLFIFTVRSFFNNLD